MCDACLCVCVNDVFLSKVLDSSHGLRYYYSSFWLSLFVHLRLSWSSSVLPNNLLGDIKLVNFLFFIFVFVFVSVFHCVSCICNCLIVRLYFLTIILGTADLSISSSWFLYFVFVSALYFPTILLETVDLSISYSSFSYLYLSWSCIFGQSSWGHHCSSCRQTYPMRPLMRVLDLKRPFIGKPKRVCWLHFTLLRNLNLAIFYTHAFLRFNFIKAWICKKVKKTICSFCFISW